jgi:hypothetical protein
VRITIKAIEALSTREPPGEALAQAEDWRDLLASLGVPDLDPRVAKLEAMIARLRAQVHPRAHADAPAPELAEFNAQVGALAASLKALESARQADAAALSNGRAAITRADALLLQHTALLEPTAGTYLQMSTLFRALAARLEGTRPIELLLERAQQRLDANQPTESLELLAEFRLATMAMDPADSHRTELVRRYEAINNGPLQLALCRRAIDQAERSREAGDADSRDWLVQDAQAYLDTASDRAPELDYEPFVRRLNRLRAASPSGRQDSARLAPLKARRDYEDALQSFARWSLDDSSRWIECARGFDELAAGPLDSEPARAERLANLLLQGLRVRLEQPRQAAASDAVALSALQCVNESLERVKRWQARDAYRILTLEARNLSVELTRSLLTRAESQLRELNVEEALASAERAAGLASGTDDARARKLIEQCKEALALRQDRDAQDKAWAQVQEVVQTHEPVAEWVALARFEKQFPGSAHAEQVAELRRSLEPTVLRQIPALLDRCDSYARERRVADYRGEVDRLETLPLSAEARAAVGKHRRQLAELDAEIDSRLSLVPARMSTRAELLDVLERLDAVLALDPNHAIALARRKEAWEQARPYAADLLHTVESASGSRRLTPAQRETQNRWLRMLLTLTPPGPTHDRATQLLQALEHSPPRK